MEQYTHQSHPKTATLKENLNIRDPLLESAVNRVNQLTSIVEAQARQLRRLESQLSELQRFITSSKR